MRKHIGMVVLAVLVLLLLLVYTVAFQVSQLSDLVVVTTFGKTTEVLSGRQSGQSGLHFKWLYPVEEEVRYDARTFLMESPLEEMSTTDKKNVMVSFFCAWRIDDANRFLPSIKTTEAAQDKVKSVVRDAMGQIVGTREFSELINTDPAKMKLSEIEAEVARVAAPKLKDEFGVGVVMIGVKRLGLNADVSKTVIDTMKAERQSKAAEYQASGEARATAIRERARAASEKILAFADRKDKDIRGLRLRPPVPLHPGERGPGDLPPLPGGHEEGPA